MAQTAVRVDSLTKEFGDLVAVDDLSFEIKEGEFFTFLGPSGCGKTTTLRMLAGFESPTAGRIQIGDDDVTDRPPYERNVGMVFQSYALFPHKTVGENVAFGLKMDGVEKAERERRAEDALEMVDLRGFSDRSPTELSGGQQQRVALARALVIEPDVLLLDEPLANLDLKLRQQMRFELKRIQEEVGITTVYVTHDQQEALSMSDRILVMNDGHAEQNDSPLGLYNNPANEFVADFIGEANLLQGHLQHQDAGELRVSLTEISDDSVILDGAAIDAGIDAGDEIVLNIRPEDVEIAPEEDAFLTGTITERTFYGQATTFHVDIGGRQLRIDSFGRDSQTQFGVGEEISVRWDPEDCQLLRGDA